MAAARGNRHAQRREQLRERLRWILGTADDLRRLGTRPEVKVAVRTHLVQLLHLRAAGSMPPFRACGFRIFSQDDEDGLILYLLAAVGVGTRRFIDIGAGDCVSASNCANLALNLGFHGLFIEADERRLGAGRAFYESHPDTRLYPPKTVQAFVTRENVNELIRTAGFEGDVDLLSVDIDGNDHWIWDAIDVVSPRIVVIETHTEHGMADVASEYRPDFDWSRAGDRPIVGASPVAMVRVADRLGYRLVGSNRYGFNAFFVRSDLAVDVLPTLEPDVLLDHPWSQEASAEDLAGPAPRPPLGGAAGR